jgi:hypothetical protein
MLYSLKLLGDFQELSNLESHTPPSESFRINLDFGFLGCDTMLHDRVDGGYQHFGETCCIHLQNTDGEEASGSSQMLIAMYQNTTM